MFQKIFSLKATLQILIHEIGYFNEIRFTSNKRSKWRFFLTSCFFSSQVFIWSLKKFYLVKSSSLGVQKIQELRNIVFEIRDYS